MTKQEIRNEWVKRLESGEIKQTRRVLGRADGSRCCLGVLCDMAVEHGITTREIDNKNICVYEFQTGLLPSTVQSWAGLINCNGEFEFDANGYRQSLVSLNDANNTFNEIANVIKSKPVGLFVSDEE